MNEPGAAQSRTNGFADRVCLLVCLGLSLGLRLLVIWNQVPQLTLDRDAYLGIAANLAEGRGFASPNSSTPTAFRPPLYPLLLAAGFKLLTVPVAVAGLNLLSAVLTVWLTADLGRLLGIGRWRFIAAGLVAIDPLLVRYSAQPMTESLCTLLAAVWLWVQVTDRSFLCLHRHRRAILVGIAFGLLVLSRPTFWPIPALCGLAWLISRRSAATSSATISKSQLVDLMATSIGTLLVVSPWVIRNVIVFGSPILMTTHGGYTLILGNNPVFYREVVQQPWGNSWPDASQKEWEANLNWQMDQAIGATASELQRDAWQSQQARHFMQLNLSDCVQAMVHRIRSLWSTSPQGEAAAGVNSWVLNLVHWFYLAELIAAAVGTVRVLSSSDRSRWWSMFILIIAVQAVHLFYWTNTRMRAPLTPAIVLFAATACSRRHELSDAH